VLVFLATEVLPGNAAYAVLGHNATPGTLHTVERQLGLNRSLVDQYWTWISRLLTGHPGTSLTALSSALNAPTTGESVWALVAPRLLNSAVLVFLAGLLGTFIGMVSGALAALRKDGWFDHVSAVGALAVTALPEFVVALGLIILFSTTVLHILPAVSVVPPGAHPWDQPRLLILPVATLVIVIVPYIQRMMRAAMIEALESDYVEMARLKGTRMWRIVWIHALPNAIAPTIQVIGLSFLYLAGGIVIVEYVYNYPGVGQALVSAVSLRDIPTIQFIVVVLAAFYVVVNICTDVIALVATPRRRIAR
jgi:peptide/nickel transport system permease protein